MVDIDVRTPRTHNVAAIENCEQDLICIKINNSFKLLSEIQTRTVNLFKSSQHKLTKIPIECGNMTTNNGISKQSFSLASILLGGASIFSAGMSLHNYDGIKTLKNHINGIHTNIDKTNQNVAKISKLLDSHMEISTDQFVAMAEQIGIFLK